MSLTLMAILCVGTDGRAMKLSTRIHHSIDVRHFFLRSPARRLYVVSLVQSEAKISLVDAELFAVRSQMVMISQKKIGHFLDRSVLHTRY